jgi:Na+-translocating ferredoxin:NAD+ oxidoreductase subunit C
MAALDTRSSPAVAPPPWPASVPEFETLPPSSRLFIPLCCAGETDAPECRPGAHFIAGQPVLASVPDRGYVPLAPADGRIVGVCRVPVGRECTVAAAEFEPDSTQPPTPETPHIPIATPRTRAHLAEWIEHLRRAGLAAHRHTSPDFLAQLHHAASRSIDTVVCNILDGDPALRLHASLAARFPAALVAGVRLLADVTGAKRSWLVSDHSAPNLWTSPLRIAARTTGVRLVGLRNDYPQSDPTLILYTLLNRRMQPAQLPTDHGVLLLDAAAAVALGRFVLESRPRLSTPIAVHDHPAVRSHYLTIPLGTTIAHVLAHRSGVRGDGILRLADPLRDLRVAPSLAFDYGELTLHAMPVEAPVNPSPCIRCTWCVEGCPTRIQPAGLLEAAQRSDPELAETFGLHACIECGICSYVCPSHLPLLPSIRRVKALAKTESRV